MKRKPNVTDSAIALAIANRYSLSNQAISADVIRALREDYQIGDKSITRIYEAVAGHSRKRNAKYSARKLETFVIRGRRLND